MGPVNDYVSSIVVAQLLFLQSESSKKPIHMYINSPGGSVTAGTVCNRWKRKVFSVKFVDQGWQ